MKKNKFSKIAVYVIAIAFIWMVALFACLLLKNEPSFNLEEITQTAGTHTYEDTILGIPVSKMVVEVAESGVVKIYNENYAMMHVFPILITFVLLGVVGVVSIVVRRISKKLEI